MLGLILFILAALGLLVGVITLRVEYEDRKNNPLAAKFDTGDILTVKKSLKYNPINYIFFGSRTRRKIFKMIGKPMEVKTSYCDKDGVWQYYLKDNTVDDSLPESWLVCQFKRD